MIKEIHATATAGVYSEVMNQIYDSFDKRIREAISNATDAKATKVTISVFLGQNTKMLIRDNGYGMTEEELENKYVSMVGCATCCRSRMQLSSVPTLLYRYSSIQKNFGSQMIPLRE